MERKTQRIIAVAVVAIIAVGSITGVSIWLLLPPVNVYEYPGLDEQKPLDSTIKVGILDDMSFTGEGCYQAAWIAAKRINEAGGVDIGGKKYFVGLVVEDTKELAGTTDEANSAAYKMVGHAPHFILGGFRTERVSSYQDILMQAHIPFIITGTASQKFCLERVGSSDFYKYTFRVMPTNNKIQGEIMGRYVANQLIQNITTYEGYPVGNITVVTEELDWTALVAEYACKEILKVYPSMVFNNISIPTSQKATYDYLGLMQTEVDGNNCPLILQVISDTTIGLKMGGTYGATQPDALLIGINIMAQFGVYPIYTGYNSSSPFALGGKSTGGMYEITSHAYADLNLTYLTLDFLSEYRTKWLTDPIYTSIGGFNGLRIGVAAINNSGKFDGDSIVTALEQFTANNPFQGVQGLVAFDDYHDYMGINGTVESEGLAETLFRQWQPYTPGAFDFNYSNPLVPGWFYGNDTLTSQFDDWMPSPTATKPLIQYKNELQFPHWWI